MGKKVFVALKMAGVAGQEKLAGIFRYLGGSQKSDWDMTLVRTSAEFTPERMRVALGSGYDGFIVSIPDTERTAALLARSTVPTVVMDIHDPGLSARSKGIVFIRNSPEKIGCAAAEFLLSTGRCRSYAFVHSSAVMEWGVDRCREFRRILNDRGLWCNELPDPSGLASLERPIGVFAANDDRGFDVLEWCRSHRLRVPEDAIVIGTNNDTLICEHCRPRLTSIQPDFEEEGFLAARELDRLMSTGGAPAREPDGRGSSDVGSHPTIYVGVKGIVKRDSSAEVSESGKLVQRALAYIRRNALRGVTPDEVAHHLGCSRRLLDLRFRELQNTTVGETVIGLRLDEVKRLLTSTTETVSAIATSCGYENPNYLRSLFRRRFGCSMREWRKGH